MKTLESIVLEYKKNVDVMFLLVILGFAILTRLLPLTLVAILFVLVFVTIVGIIFHEYADRKMKGSAKSMDLVEYSWGFVKEVDLNTLDHLKKVFKFAVNQDVNFYKEFLQSLKNEIILFTFIFGDLVVAFKNLDLDDSGAYFSLSVFCKFIFLGYLYINKSYDDVTIDGIASEDGVLDIFYKHLNGIISISVVLLLLTFLLSRFIVEIFFGQSYLYFHTSLPSVMFANLSMFIALFMYKTAILVNEKSTKRILKVYLPIFAILFVFIPISLQDTVAYFVIGSSAILSIFLYNYVIKKPSYILNTYNHLF